MNQLWKGRRKYPESVKARKEGQTRMDLMCDNPNCPAGNLKLNTMSAQGDPHWSTCDMCCKTKMLKE